MSSNFPPGPGIPRVRRVVIAGVGHIMYFEQLAEFGRLAVSFISRTAMERKVAPMRQVFGEYKENVVVRCTDNCHAGSDPEYGPAATRGECTGSDERRQGEHTRPIRPTMPPRCWILS